MNERLAPILLPHHMECVDFLVSTVSRISNQLANFTGDKAEIFGAKRHEIARIQYIVHAYMR